MRLAHATLQDRVYRELRAAIRAGQFASGESLTIRNLAALLGTSPMPVRDALRRLAQDKILEQLPNRTTRVPVLSAARFAELADVRALVEGHAAALAAQSMTAAEFATARAANEQMSRAIDRGDLADVNAANERFHFAVYRAAHSATLLTVIEGLWEQSGPYLASLTRRMLQAQSLRTLAIVHHFELLAALGRQDPEAARKAVSDDINYSAQWYREAGQLAAPSRPLANMGGDDDPQT